jgi:pimeloyl-ACP methyl ester carboxylesterase
MVELLLAGATYDHHYWNTPGYSYVDFAAKSGRTTFSVDRIGTGESGKPPADAVTMQVHAFVAGQLVTALRVGSVTGSRVSRVIGVGHSVGAAVWMVLFGTTSDSESHRERPDALVLQDFMHDVNVSHITAIGQARYPASDDPRFANAGLPAGYLTTRPGTRTLFYDTRFVSSRVLRHDESTKSLTTTGEVSSLGVGRDPEMSRAIDVPTLVILGTNDALYCNDQLPCRTVADLRERESQFYTGTPTVKWVVLPLAGHDASSHYDAYVGFATVRRWLS